MVAGVLADGPKRGSPCWDSWLYCITLVVVPRLLAVLRRFAAGQTMRLLCATYDVTFTSARLTTGRPLTRPRLGR